MKPATKRQRDRMMELGIEFDHDIEMDEAAMLLRDHLVPVAININLGEHALIELSEPDGDQ